MKKTTCAALIALFAAMGLSLGSAAEAGDASGTRSASAAARLAGLDTMHGLESPWQEALERAINPDDYECNPTAFDAWIGGRFAELIANDWLDEWAVIQGYGALQWATYYSAFFDNDASDDYIGVEGEYTRLLQQLFKDHRRFWNIDSADILLQGMHGSDLADDAKMVPTVMFLFFTDQATAQGIVDAVQAAIENSIGYDHPFLTLNAFAFSAEGEEIPGVGLVPDKIVMGEGILEALDDMGLGAEGAEFVLAHEFAHHVQFESGAWEAPPGYTQPEATRRTELMADAWASYYLAHKRGGTWRKSQILIALASAYVVGDCQFANPGHHGTPNQREAAADWGADLAIAAQKKGHKSGWETMLALFEAKLPDLVAPDAE